MEDKMIDALNKITSILFYLENQLPTTSVQRKDPSYARFEQNLRDLRGIVENINVLKNSY